MSVLRIQRACALLGVLFSVAACSDDTSSSDEPVTTADAGNAGHSAQVGAGGKASTAAGSGGKGGAGGRVSGINNNKGQGGAGGKASAAGGTDKGKSTGGQGSAAGSGGKSADGDAGIDLEDAGASALPQEYKITFSTTMCFGRCPVYSVSLDQDGNVEFDGQQNVANEGKSTKQVAPNAAADVYEGLLAAHYFELKDQYKTVQDGCQRVRTDSPTHNWSVVHDGKTKTLSQYLGCEGVAALDKVEAVSRLLIEKSAVAEWIGNN